MNRLRYFNNFFFIDAATTKIYTLSYTTLFRSGLARQGREPAFRGGGRRRAHRGGGDRMSTRLNSSHRCISYAVFCLKKKNITFLIISFIYIILFYSLHTYYIIYFF